MSEFADLLANNARYSACVHNPATPGKAAAGVMIITCMDGRIDPLAIVGLQLGDAKVLRSPGGHLSDAIINGAIVGVHLLGVKRIMVIGHTRCAMAAESDQVLCERIAQAAGLPSVDLALGSQHDQRNRVINDVKTLVSNELIGPYAEVGGFELEINTGVLTQLI